MATFGNLTLGTLTYKPLSDGQYMESTIAPGAPRRSYSLRRGSIRKDKKITAGATMLRERLTAAGLTEQAYVTINVVAPQGALFTATEISNMVTHAAEFFTVANTTDLLNGKN